MACDLRCLAHAFLILSLPSCGVEYDVERMGPTDLNNTQENGLTFRLSNSEIQATMVFERLDYPVRNFRNLANYKKKCDEGSQQKSLDQFKADNDPSYRIVSSSAAINGIPRDDMVFRLNISGGILSTYNHKIETDENGLIGSGATTLENTATALATNVIQIAGAIATTVIDPLSDELVAATPDKTIKEVTANKFCEEIADIAASVEDYTKKREMRLQRKSMLRS